MKIRVTKKADKASTGIIDLCPAISVFQVPLGEGQGVALDILAPGDVTLQFPESDYTFEYVEVSMSDELTFVEHTIPEILELYAAFG